MFFLLRVVPIIFMIYGYWPSISHANSLIKNDAYGYVKGSITQIADRNAINSIAIGSIDTKTTARRNRTRAYVQGDVTVRVKRNSKLVLNIGSVHDGE